MQGRPNPPAPIYCPCGTVNPPGSIFCSQCRRPLQGVVPGAAPARSNTKPCWDCGQMISLRAVTCPRCGGVGHELPPRVSFAQVFRITAYAWGSVLLLSLIAWLVATLLGLLFGGAILPLLRH